MKSIAVLLKIINQMKNQHVVLLIYNFIIVGEGKKKSKKIYRKRWMNQENGAFYYKFDSEVNKDGVSLKQI